MKLSELMKKPAMAGFLGALIGLIVGLIWAWYVQPVIWTNVPPSQMGTLYQERY
jgi:ABC-type lipoprotein release transport system permease subunit